MYLRSIIKIVLPKQPPQKKRHGLFNVLNQILVYIFISKDSLNLYRKIRFLSLKNKKNSFGIGIEEEK